jgi:hypothetical protein
MLSSIAITIPNHASINVQVSPASKANSKSSASSSNSQTLTFQLFSSSKLPDFASVIINLTSFPNLGPSVLPFGLHIFLAKEIPSTTITSFIFSSSFNISLK